MPTFAYRAFDDRGKRARGTISASSPRHAREQLRDRGLQIESVTARKSFVQSNSKKNDRQSADQRFRRTRYRSQTTAMIRELATLLQAGVPLLDSIDSALSQTRRGFRDAMLAVRDRVAGGSSLADAMVTEPHVFDEMTTGMIRVGEHAGNLDEVCEQLADFRERNDQLKDRVFSSLLYPLIILAVSVGVTIFMMTVVVPMLLQNLIEIGRPLPLPTLILKKISDLVLGYGHWLFFALASLVGIVIALLQTENGRRRFDQLALATPVFGPLIQKQTLSRMALVVSSLLRSGVELVDALQIAQRSATNGLLKTALSEMRVDLEAGKDLGNATRRHKIFSHALAQVLALGQQSGQLDRMLERIGNDYDRQAGILANRLATVIEPVLIIMLSVVVGFILFATVLPILEAGNVLAE